MATVPDCYSSRIRMKHRPDAGRTAGMIEQLTIGQQIARIFRPGRPRRRVLAARLEHAPEIDVRIRTGNVSFHRIPPGSRGVGVRAEIRSHSAEIAASTSLDVVRTHSSIRIECIGDHVPSPVTAVSCDIDVWVPDGVLCRARVGVGSIRANNVMTSRNLLRASLGRVRVVDCRDTT
jgi:hypothetical protein